MELRRLTTDERAVIDAIQAAILADNWRLAHAIADDNSIGLCLRCFLQPQSGPTNLRSGRFMRTPKEDPFCVSCLRAHDVHFEHNELSPIETCPKCDVAGSIQRTAYDPIFGHGYLPSE